MLSTMETEEKLKFILPLEEQAVVEGLVILSDVNIIKYSCRALEIDQSEA